MPGRRILNASIGLAMLAMAFSVPAMAQAIVWKKLPDPTHYAISSIAIARNGGIFIATEGDGVYRSSDGGNNWDHVLQSHLLLHSISLLRSGAILAAGDRIYRSGDNGMTWDTVTGKLTFYTTGDEGESGAMAAGTDGKVYRSTDDGRSWEVIASLDSGYTLFGIARDSTGRLLIGNGRGLHLSNDGGETWQMGKDLADDIDQIHVAPSGRVFVGTGNGTVYTSDDGGTTWDSYRPDGINPSATSFVTHPAAGTFATEGDVGVMLWNEELGTWRLENEGLPATGYNPMFGLALDPANNLYMVGNGIYRAELSGGGLEAPMQHSSGRTLEAMLSREREELTLILPERDHPTGIVVTDVLGDVMATLLSHTGNSLCRIGVAGWPAGGYLVRVTSGAGVETKLVILTR